MWHRHVWKIIDKQILPSPAEIFYENGGTHLKGYDGYFFFSNPVIISYRCETCDSEKVVKK